jgi:hypothetical protein
MCRRIYPTCSKLHGLNNNHHVVGKDMCVWGFCVSIFEAKKQASISHGDEVRSCGDEVRSCGDK